MTTAQRKTLNALLHKLIRLRDGAYCLRCGKTERLQLSHIYPKGKHRKLEFEPNNLKILCSGCHLYWWHKNPIDAHEWLKTAIPKDRYDRLRLMANTVHYQKLDYKLIKLFIEKEIDRLSSATQ